jgi:4'-phosphopantetheinyl transferase
MRTCPSCGRPHGKPRLLTPREPRLDFSVSHAGDVVVVAVVVDGQVGVDVEKISVEPSDHLANAVLSVVEQRSYASLSSCDQMDAFFVYWTRKEAVLKALGVGLSIHPQDVVVSPHSAAPRVLAVPNIRTETVSLFDLPRHDGHVASLAVIGSCRRVEAFDALPLLGAALGPERQRVAIEMKPWMRQRGRHAYKVAEAWEP